MSIAGHFFSPSTESYFRFSVADPSPPTMRFPQWTDRGQLLTCVFDLLYYEIGKDNAPHAVYRQRGECTHE